MQSLGPGVAQIDLLYHIEKFPKISMVSSASSKKWISQKKYNDVDKCLEELRVEGFKVYGSLLSKSAESIYEVDFTEKVAIIMGNENRGLSDKIIEKVDQQIYIPMRGMIQSLNVSVAAAVILYEAQRQRSLKGMYDKSELSKNELDDIIDQWCKK